MLYYVMFDRYFIKKRLISRYSIIAFGAWTLFTINAGCVSRTVAAMMTSVVTFIPLLCLMAVFSVITFSVGFGFNNRTVNQESRPYSHDMNMGVHYR